MKNPDDIYYCEAHDKSIFRPMSAMDLPAVLSIEQLCYDFPWTGAVFMDCLRVGYYCQVIEQHKKITGYGILSTGAGEAHILNLCIQPQSRRQGLARSLLAKFIDEARRLHIETIILEVRPSNTAALKLYDDMGFNEIGLRKDYYPALNGREDAIMLARAL